MRWYCLAAKCSIAAVGCCSASYLCQQHWHPCSTHCSPSNDGVAAAVDSDGYSGCSSCFDVVAVEIDAIDLCRHGSSL